ncbi:reverse transcriptase domain-containing protein [Tanacetum coccineum]
MTSRPRTRIPSRPRLGVWQIGNQSQGYREPGDLYKLLLVQIMAASAIIISSDSSDESVGSPPSRVILFGDIPTIIPSTSVVAPETSTIAPVISSATPMVETTLGASPIGLCGLVPYTGSDSDSPDEMTSPEHISPLPAISPFICTDSSEAPDSSDGPPLQDPYVKNYMIVGGEGNSTVLHQHMSFLLLYYALPEIVDARRLASKHASSRSPDHHSSSSSSSSDSSPVHSLGLDASDHAHSRSLTRDVSPRLCYPPRRAPRRSEAFCRWCTAPLSTLYPPTTSESSSGDSSEGPMHLAPHSARPSRKRCRSLVNSVPLSMPVTGSLAPTHADFLPPRKRFRDSYSSDASLEEDAKVGLTGIGVDMELGISDGDEVGDHVEIDHRDARDDTEEYEADASAGDTAEVGIDPMTAPLVEEEIVEPAGEDSPDSSGTRDGIVRSVEDMPVDLEDGGGRSLVSSLRPSRMAEMIYSLRLENLKVRAMLDIKRDRVSSLRLHMSLSQEEFRQIRRDRDDARGRLRRTIVQTLVLRDDPRALKKMINQRVNAALEARRVNQNLELGNGHEMEKIIGNGNEIDNETRNGNDIWNVMECNGNGNNGGGTVTCQPTSFKGTKGVVGLIGGVERWRTVGAFGTVLYALYGVEADETDDEVYCPGNEIKDGKLSCWNLSVKNNDIAITLTRSRETHHDCAPNLVPRRKMGWEIHCLLPLATSGYHPATPTQRGQMVNQRVVTCFECGAQGHYRKDCPKIKNQNRGDKARVPDARGRAYALGGDKEEHDVHLRLILELLKKEELYAKFSKCDFWLSKVQFLGHVIDSEGIHVDPAKIESIKDWESPKTPIEIRQFLAKKSMRETHDTWFGIGICGVALQDVEIITFTDELLSDYDCKLRFHPGKANVVADALSRKNRPKPLRVRALIMTIGLNLPARILNAQVEARKEENYGTEDLRGMIKNLELRADEMLCLKNRSWIPRFGDLRVLIMHESHSNVFNPP